MTLNRQILRKIDDKLRSESDQETGEWMAKVPISGATKAVWQRYCQAVGVHMGQGVAILINHELASVVDEDLETLSDLVKERQAELDERESAVARAEKELDRQQRDVEVREARVRERERDLARRETNLTVAERRLAISLPSATRTQQGSTHKGKLGRNEPCWCKSGKKYKNCHLASDQTG
ncbi:MAG TPA: SEC-C domain-containing protein [Acidimicrobiia bacterium]|jgi:CRISPR/Cas system-associated endonuclease Cas3-HD|nr:SEC-C domain-containing protein [Acidimicrobiia bacterium]